MAARTNRRTAGPGAGRAGAPVSQKQFNEMGLLLRVAREVGAHDTLDAMLRTIVEHSTAETNAERGTLFLNDEQTKELYSRVAQGDVLPRDPHPEQQRASPARSSPRAGAIIVHDAYADPRFNRAIDEQTGYVTKDIVCAPVKTVKGEVIGVAAGAQQEAGQVHANPTCACSRR